MDRARSTEPTALPRTAVSPDGAAVPARVAVLLRQVATQLEGQADEIAMTMVRAYEHEIPAYGEIADEALLG